MSRASFAPRRVLSLIMLLIAAASSQTRITCIGTSITAMGYPAILQRLLDGGFTVENDGTTAIEHGDVPYRQCECFHRVHL